jgi:hypothetical protein
MHVRGDSIIAPISFDLIGGRDTRHVGADHDDVLHPLLL